MANLGGTFDANSVAPQQPIEALPPGDYPVQIVQSEMKPTKAGTGQFLWLEMDIIDGPAKGRKVWDRLNLINPNQQAQEIAQRTLSAICHATGQLSVSDSEQLHFKPLLAKVKVRKREDTGEPSNEIGGYSPLNGKAAPAQAQAPATQSSAPPWKRAS